MSGFSADWLALREPFDLAARNPDVLGAVAAMVSHQPAITIVDLACGTGSTLRAVAPKLAPRQSWKLIDNDLSLLARAAAPPHPPRSAVTATPVDLAHDLEAALDGSVDLVTTSALLDLVSEVWLERLVVEIAARRLPLYAALTYDGRIAFEPAIAFDADIMAAVNAHQHGDKGFGPALGPDAAAKATTRFTALGYQVITGFADWSFAPGDAAIQLETVRGWALAAQEILPSARDRVAEWLLRRQQLVHAGSSTIRVGHVDFLVVPSG